MVRAVLGDEHAFAYETVKDWPIAFIQEYVKRLRFMNPEEAAASVKELAHRVKRLKKYDDDDDDDDEVSIDKMGDDEPPQRPRTHAIPRDLELTYVSGDGFADAIKKAVRKKKRGGKGLKNILLKG